MSTGDQSITRSHYDVIVDPTRLELRVEWRFTGAAARGHVRAEIPALAPGDYSFSPLARDVFDVQARTADGRAHATIPSGWALARPGEQFSFVG